MDRHNKAGKERKAKAREENKLPKAPLNEDRSQESVLTNELAIQSVGIDEMAQDYGPGNGSNEEAMETEVCPSGSPQLGKSGGGSKARSYSNQSSAQFEKHGYQDSRTAGRRIRVAGSDFKRIDSLGRQLSSVLRHRAVNLGLKMRSDGYVLVNDLLNLRLKTQAGLPLSSHTVDDIKEAVKRDNKQRFGLREENGQLLIRANQGHSINVTIWPLLTVKSEDLSRPILSPEEVPVCVHGTYFRFLDSIQKQGLKRMKRLHVHFATGLFKEKGVISGMRSNCEVLIHLNVQKYLEDGMKLYCSENGVILAEGKSGVIPPDYFAKIEQVKC